jgi:hypothetical protein
VNDIALDTRTTGELIVTSRLLVMQSKRLMLASVERRSMKGGHNDMRVRAARLHAASDRAHHAYQSSVLAWSAPGSSEYRLAAYGRLVGLAENLSSELQHGLGDLPAGERFEVSTEVQMLEEFIQQWRKGLLTSVSPTD